MFGQETLGVISLSRFFVAIDRQMFDLLFLHIPYLAQYLA